jgi:hypothetical protein
MVQMRTLNMDRELLQEKVGFPEERGLGIQEFMEAVSSALPGIEFASHTPYRGRAREYVS